MSLKVLKINKHYEIEIDKERTVKQKEKEVNRDIQRTRKEKDRQRRKKIVRERKDKQKETDKDRKKRHVDTELVKPRGCYKERETEIGI